MSARRYPAPAERLGARTVQRDSGCIEWTGPRHDDDMGYGRMRFNGRMAYVHRIAWELEHGPIAVGLVVRHRCDNPLCVNTQHLVLGTQADNVRDMFDRQRADRRGDRANPAVLTWPQVRAIRQLYEGGTRSIASLAREFEMSRSQIGNIVHHRHWKESA